MTRELWRNHGQRKGEAALGGQARFPGSPGKVRGGQRAPGLGEFYGSLWFKLGSGRTAKASLCVKARHTTRGPDTRRRDITDSVSVSPCIL